MALHSKHDYGRFDKTFRIKGVADELNSFLYLDNCIVANEQILRLLNFYDLNCKIVNQRYMFNIGRADAKKNKEK